MSKTIATILMAALCLAHPASLYARSHSAQDFFKEAVTTLPALSPSGRYVVSLHHSVEKTELVRYDSVQDSNESILDLAVIVDEEDSIRTIDWIDENHIAIQLVRTKSGVEEILDTKLQSQVLIVPMLGDGAIEDRILRVRTKGWLIDSMSTQDYVFHYAKSGISSKIYLIDVRKLAPSGRKLSKLSKVDGGQFIKANEVSSVKGHAVRWFRKNGQKPNAVLHYVKGDLLLSTLDDNSESREIKRWSRSELENRGEGSDEQRLIPLKSAQAMDTFYALDVNEDDERSIFEVNYVTGEQKLIMEVDAFRITDLLIDDNGNLYGARVLKDAALETIYLDPDADRDRLDDPMPGSVRVDIARSANGMARLFYRESHNNPGRFYIKRSNSDNEQEFASVYPHLKGKLSSVSEESSLTIDGLKIPYILSTPSRRSGEQFPLLITPHGGPIGVHDAPYFDLATQFWVDNGYAVLRVNFRGSSGFSKELKKGAKGHWERLLTDIYEVASVVSRREDIDQHRVCAVGASYGGYAASQLAVQNPGWLKCVVNISGISDVNLYLNSAYSTEAQLKWKQEWIGDSETDYERFKLLSPVYRARELQVPILILHGEKDRIVDVEHARRLYAALSKHNNSVQIHIYPEMGHSPLDIEVTKDVYSRAAIFLRSHL